MSHIVDVTTWLTFSLQERVKERSLRQKDNMTTTTNSHNFQVEWHELTQAFRKTQSSKEYVSYIYFIWGCIQEPRRKNATIPTSANSFSDEEETRQMLSISKPSQGRGGATRRGMGKGSRTLKQMSLDETMKTRQSKRWYFWIIML